MEQTPYLCALQAAATNLEVSARAWVELEPKKVTLVEFLLIESHRKGFLSSQKGRMVSTAFKNGRAHPSMMGGPIISEVQRWADGIGIDLRRFKITPRTKTEVLLVGLMGRPCLTVRDLKELCHVSTGTARTWLTKLTDSGHAIRRCVGNTDYYFIPTTVYMLTSIAAGFSGQGERPNIESVREIFARKVEISFPAEYARYEFVTVSEHRNL